MKKILTLILSVHVFFVFSQDVSIVDKNLLARLIELNIDTNKDGKIQVSEAKSKTGSLTLSGQNITHMHGIEAFTNITTLSCADNNISTLDVSTLTKLQYLTCSNNSLTSLDVSALTKLKSLVCISNSLKSLDLSNQSSLTKLWCHNNLMTSLILPTNNVITEIFCQNNKLTSVDFTNSVNLITLNCYSNDLVGQLNLSTLTKLTKLGCYFNPNLQTICLSSLVSKTPSFTKDGTANWGACTVTSSVENSEITANVIKAYNLQGMEVDPSTKNQTIFLMYDNGQIQKVYQE